MEYQLLYLNNFRGYPF